MSDVIELFGETTLGDRGTEWGAMRGPSCVLLGGDQGADAPGA